MVQHAPPSANNWPLHYWKLPHVELTHRIDLQNRLNVLHYFWPASATTPRLQYLSNRANRGLISYDSCTTIELHSFCVQRKLIAKDDLPTTPGFASTRPNLITLLETSDDAQTFPLLALPPELREKVYAHHILSLLPPLHPPHEAFLTQSMTMPPPPLIEVSRLLRKEALPIFYDLHRAKIGVIDPYGNVFSDKAYAITEPVDALIARAPDAVIGRYQSLELSGIVSMNGRSGGRCGVWFEVEMPRERRKGSVKMMGKFGGAAVMERFEGVVVRMEGRLQAVLDEMTEHGRGLESSDLELFRKCFAQAV